MAFNVILVARLELELEADDTGVCLPEPLGDNTTVGLVTALDYAAELSLLGQLLGFLGERC